jgi:hypothetical protein
VASHKFVLEAGAGAAVAPAVSPAPPKAGRGA